MGFLCGGTRIKEVPFFLSQKGSRAAKDPPNLKWENQGMGIAVTVEGISTVVLHQISMSRRTPTKQSRNFRKTGRMGWLPATKLGASH